MREAGGRVRITAQLVSAVDGYQLWSQTYDRQLADVLAVQDDIARAVAGALRVTLVGGGNTAARAPNAEAYNLRLRALHVIKRQNPESTAEARSFADWAIALDPGYADACARPRPRPGGRPRASREAAPPALGLSGGRRVDAARAGARAGQHLRDGLGRGPRFDARALRRGDRAAEAGARGRSAEPRRGGARRIPPARSCSPCGVCRTTLPSRSASTSLFPAARDARACCAWPCTAARSTLRAPWRRASPPARLTALTRAACGRNGTADRARAGARRSPDPAANAARRVRKDRRHVQRC